MKTYLELLHDHITFLRGHGLDVDRLKIGSTVRCSAIGKTQGRGELAYPVKIKWKMDM